MRKSYKVNRDGYDIFALRIRSKSYHSINFYYFTKYCNKVNKIKISHKKY